ncbi:MAG: hypothetical protein IJP70_10265 [Bacteroidales bacterium]|nr:hypothetical protein [Bacteroidales bacterium]
MSAGTPERRKSFLLCQQELRNAGNRSRRVSRNSGRQEIVPAVSAGTPEGRKSFPLNQR